MTEFNNNE